MTRLCERGVAASNAHPDGGFASIDRDASARLAPGAIKDACLDASQRRRAPAPIRAIRAPEGADAHLGWMATAAMAAERFESGPAGVVGVVGVPPREVARAATLTRADWLGRRVEGSGAGWAELDGDTTEDARRTGRDASRGFSGASAGSPSAGSPSAGSAGVGSPGGIPGSAGFTFDASRRFPGPGPEPETVPAAAVTPAPPAFTPAPPARGFVRHPDDDEKGNDSDDGFDVSSDEDDDASGGFGTRGAAKIKFQISPATTAAAAATPTFAIAPPGATPAGVPALPAPGMETSSTLTPAPGTVTSSTLTSTSPAAVADPFGVGFASGFGGGAAAASAATDAVPVPTIDLDANDPFGGVVMTPEDEVDEDPFGDASEDEGEEESDAFTRRATELDVDDPFGGGGDGAFQGGAFGGGAFRGGAFGGVVGDGSSSVAVATPVALAGVGGGGR